MITLILLVIWCPLMILGFNLWDYYITKDGGKPVYLIYWLVKGIAAIVHGTICLIFLEDRYHDYGALSWWRLLMVWLPYVGFQVCSFWLLYEIVRNIWTKKDNLLYYDTEEKDSGWVDRFFAWTGPTFHAMIKIMALAIMVFCIFVIWTRH